MEKDWHSFDTIVSDRKIIWSNEPRKTLCISYRPRKNMNIHRSK